MIKQTNYLEAAAGIDAVVLDKTGTITTGSVRGQPPRARRGRRGRRPAAAPPTPSRAPTTRSLRRSCGPPGRPDQTAEVAHYEEIHGRGVKANTGMGEIHAGRAAWLRELVPDAGRADRRRSRSASRACRACTCCATAGTSAPWARGQGPRPGEARVERLREVGVRVITIFTGDRLSVAKRVGVAVGADRLEAECLPEEKHEQIRGMVRQGYKTMMVGDGINDGPALAEADVGVAMGLRGSDIAANSAGVALMTDDLNRLPFLIDLGRKTRAITGQNIAASILIALDRPDARGDGQPGRGRRRRLLRRDVPLRGRCLRAGQLVPPLPLRRGLPRA
jgi:Cd2+/Zn2+-exporting ATPase